MSRSSRWSVGAVTFVIVMAILGALVERATHKVAARIDGQFGYTPDPAGTKAFLAELDSRSSLMPPRKSSRTPSSKTRFYTASQIVHTARSTASRSGLGGRE